MGYNVVSAWQEGDGSFRDWSFEKSFGSLESAKAYIDYQNDTNDHFDGCKEFKIVPQLTKAYPKQNQPIKNNNMNKNYQNNNWSPRRSTGYQSNSNNNNQNKPVKKKSGCSMKRYFPQSGPNKGVEQAIVNGWKKIYKGALLVFTAVTTSKSKVSDKGWYGSVAVTVLDKKTMQKQFYWATMHKSTGKTVIQDLGIVMNPKGGKGGVVAEYGKR